MHNTCAKDILWKVTGVYNVSNQPIRDLGLILAGNRSPID